MGLSKHVVIIFSIKIDVVDGFWVLLGAACPILDTWGLLQVTSPIELLSSTPP